MVLAIDSRKKRNNINIIASRKNPEKHMCSLVLLVPKRVRHFWIPNLRVRDVFFVRICGQKAAAGGERIGSFYCHVAPYTSNFLEACGWELGEDIFDRYIDRGSVHNYVILYES